MPLGLAGIWPRGAGRRSRSRLGSQCTGGQFQEAVILKLGHLTEKIWDRGCNSENMRYLIWWQGQTAGFLVARSKVLPRGWLGRSGSRNASQMSLKIRMWWILSTVNLTGFRIIGRQISENDCDGVSRLGQLRWGKVTNTDGTVNKHFGRLHVVYYVFPGNLGLPFMGF